MALINDIADALLENLKVSMADTDAADEMEEERQKHFNPIVPSVLNNESVNESFPDHEGRPGQRGGSSKE